MIFDDYPDYMIRWLRHRPRGLGIMPVTSYNKDFHHPNVVKYDGNLTLVRAAFVKRRKPGEPLVLGSIPYRGAKKPTRRKAISWSVNCWSCARRFLNTMGTE